MSGGEVTAKMLEPVHGVSARDTIHGTGAIGPLIRDVLAGVSGAGLAPDGAPIAIYHDPEFDPERMDVEVFCPVGRHDGEPVPTPSGRSLTARTMEGGTAAVLVHVGRYDEIPGAYRRVFRWMEEHGHRIAGPPQEVYVSDLAGPGPHTTEIRIPIAPA